MGQVFSLLAAVQEGSTKSLFITVDDEECPDVSEVYDVSAVPSTVLTKAGNIPGIVNGWNPAALRDLLRKYLPDSSATTTSNHPDTAMGIPSAQETVMLPVLQSVPMRQRLRQMRKEWEWMGRRNHSNSVYRS